MLLDAPQVVLLVLDGLGWDQLAARATLAPTLAAMAGGPISSVAPTTTATALTSLTLGMAPARHGVVGYKFAIEGPTGPEVLNVLRWTTPSGDARSFFHPTAVQSGPAFLSRAVPVVSKRDFIGSAFTTLHQSGAVQVGWSVPSSIPVLCRHLLAQGEPFVYAYYEGVDKVAHATGLGDLYDAELASADALVARILEELPPGAVLAVTADHGQVDVGSATAPVAPELTALCSLISGESRFRWLHARAGGAAELAARARETYGHEAWVTTVDELSDLGIMGGPLEGQTRARVGDVLLVPLGPHAYLDPQDPSDATLVCRHGGLCQEEVLVPLVAARSND